MFETEQHQRKKAGRSLRLFLADGSPTGVITAELGNWSGKVVVAPRTVLPELIKREEAGQTGVYLLAGTDADDPARTLVYVGEGDSIKTRLSAHDAEESKQFFTRVCVIVSKDGSLTKAHGRYLEARLIELVRSAARATLVNGTAPVSKGLPEGDIADMEGFLAEIAVILPVVGFDVLRHAADSGAQDRPDAEASPIFIFTEAQTDARAMETGGEFVVLKGSLARKKVTNTISETARKQREQLVADGALVPDQDDNLLEFVRDVAFSSPSAAAAVVYGGNISGPQKWRKENDGKAYKDWRREKLAEAQAGAGNV